MVQVAIHYTVLQPVNARVKKLQVHMYYIAYTALHTFVYTSGTMQLAYSYSMAWHSCNYAYDVRHPSHSWRGCCMLTYMSALGNPLPEE